MTGPLTCPLQNGLRMTAQPTNEVVSMIGMAYATLNDKYQIQVGPMLYIQRHAPALPCSRAWAYWGSAILDYNLCV